MDNLHDRLRPFVDRRLIAVQKHPTEDLWVYNYTKKTQYERAWTEETLSARGLILDAAGRPVARPFPKFFNLDEMGPEFVPPAEPFTVTEKLDGSLGITYPTRDGPALATRGSFTGDQAVVGTRLLRGRYGHLLPRLDPAVTYLFEIIYPANRIVVDYGDREDLVLLAALDTASGADLAPDGAPPDLGFPTVERWDGLTDLGALRHLAGENREGFVVRFASGLRLKVKFADYVRLHRLVTGVTSRVIWDLLRHGQSVSDLTSRVPEEFADWVARTEADLRAAHAAIETQTRAAFRDLGDRRQTAAYFQTQPHPQLLFAMLDGKPYDELIWKLLRPPIERPFKEAEG